VEFLENKDFKGQTDETRQDRGDRPDRTEETGHERQEQRQEQRQDGEIITLLKETTGLLKEQLVKKDEQIKDLGGKIDQLIERNRETNLLIGQLQSKVLMLEKPKEAFISEITEETGQDTPDKTGQDKDIKPLKEKKTKQAEPKAETKARIKARTKAGFWQRLFK